MITWFTGDVFDGLATLEDGSIDLVVTSPPFLALRSYLPADHPDKGKEVGTEATPAAFVNTLLEVTAELRRVLAPHGSIAIELGDTYAGDSAYKSIGDANHGYGDRQGQLAPLANRYFKTGDDWPLAKSKTLIPELYRIALAYGFNPLTGEESPAGRWRVRNVVTWCRPNPPVGALGDKWRPATSDIVVACVSDKRYWDDLATRKANPRQSENWAGAVPYDIATGRGNGTSSGQNPLGAPLLDYWEIPLLDGEEPKPYGPKPPKRNDGIDGVAYYGSAEKGPGNQTKSTDGGEHRVIYSNPAGAPLLDYWEIPPTGYAGAHYAVYPPALVEPLVKAMCPEKVCRTCGEPSRRIVEAEQFYRSTGEPTKGKRAFTTGASLHAGLEDKQTGVLTPLGHDSSVERRVVGEHWTDCGHDDWRPGRVLDPFAGSGTTLAVASGHGHDTIGFDLDPRNEDLARERVGPLLWQGVSDV